MRRLGLGMGMGLRGRLRWRVKLGLLEGGLKRIVFRVKMDSLGGDQMVVGIIPLLRQGQGQG